MSTSEHSSADLFNRVLNYPLSLNTRFEADGEVFVVARQIHLIIIKLNASGVECDACRAEQADERPKNAGLLAEDISQGLRRLRFTPPHRSDQMR